MTQRMNRRLGQGLLAGALALGALTACGGGSGADSTTVVVGSANFPESELLMQIYAQALEGNGVDVETKPNIGSRQVYMKAFESGEIDVLPEYNGALLSYLSGGTAPQGVTAPDAVYSALTKVLPEGSEALTQSAAEDKDTLTVTSETAAKYNLATIADLAEVADQLVMGAAPEWQKNYAGALGLKEVYGITFKQFKPLDTGGPLTVNALKKGDIDVANVYSTNSAIPANKWIALKDDKNFYLAQNVVPLVRKDKADDTVRSTLEKVSAALTTENLTAALAQVTDDKQSARKVAEEFVKEHDLG